MFLDIWQTVAIIYVALLFLDHRKHDHKDDNKKSGNNLKLYIELDQAMNIIKQLHYEGMLEQQTTETDWEYIRSELEQKCILNKNLG